MGERYDVVVVGSGIAGSCAACSAAEALAGKGSVLLASAGPTFSGSSFFRGTWGLGLIAPVSDSDVADLAATIAEVGCGQVDAALVESFVAGIEPAVERVEDWGVVMRRAAQGAASQREYIPCFDHKHRRWRGLECASYREVVGARLGSLGVHCAGGLELMGILKADSGAVCAAVFWDEAAGSFCTVGCGALVLAGGGAGSLFSRRLTSGDCRSTMQALAAEAGARLVNMEFIQFMPGMVSPRSGLVFNEKTFKYMRLAPELVEQLGGAAVAEELLDQRSGYGPFTSRLASSAIDLSIDAAGPSGLLLTPAFPEELPEFVQVYNSWLEDEMGIDPCAELRVALYAHASNGGIAIDARAHTGVPGLFAAGECTGGMHGADRLGGLSTANCLVFGLRAGESAARWASEAAPAASVPVGAPAWLGKASDEAAAVEKALRAVMDAQCMALRTRTGLAGAVRELGQLRERLEQGSAASCSAAQVAATRRTALRLGTALAVAEAALQRPQSCGSHCIAEG